MGLSVKVESHVPETKEALRDAVERALTAIGQQCVSHAKQELNGSPHRIDTGLLVNSLTFALSGKPTEISTYKADKPRYPGRPIETGSYSGSAPNDSETKKAVYVGTNVEYAIYVHEGTSRMTPNRFLKNAVVNNMDEYASIAKQELDKG